MADNENNNEEQNTEKKQKETKSFSLIFYAVLVVIVITCAGAGLGLAHLFAGTKTGKTAPATQKTEQKQTQQNLAPENNKEQKFWYYELDPVIANLNDPGVRRFVRMTVILQINPSIDKAKGTSFLSEKKPLITNYLTVYLTSLSIEDVRGSQNIEKIQSQIKDLLNQKLFPDTTPEINTILFKEFSIQ